MSSRLAGLGVGLVFGVTLCWSGVASPVVIRQALLFEDSYLYFLFASAVLVAAVGLALLRRGERRALLTGAPLRWTPERPARRHIVGAAVFGLGWGIADACPGPIAAQVGQGIAWGCSRSRGSSSASISSCAETGRRQSRPRTFPSRRMCESASRPSQGFADRERNEH